MEKESKIEKISGNPLLNLSATALAAAAGGPLAALLPSLSGTLAASRHKKRIENAFEEINIKIEALGEKLKDITDSQYKLAMEFASIILRTTDDNKIEYLKKAIKNGLEIQYLDDKLATSLSRAIRDITAAEAAFLLKNIDYREIYVDYAVPEGRNAITVNTKTEEYGILIGLSALGLVTLTSVYAGMDAYCFSDVAFEIVKLFKD
ncbi:MAG: hypothetical protein ACLQF0_16995 [Dissulfurispiraceae bacterium]